MFLSDGLFFISFSFLDERKGGKRKSRHQGCQPIYPGTSKIFDLPLPEKMNMRRIWMSPCRGVLHTPYGRSIYGTMSHDNWHGLRIRHPWDGF